MFDGSRGLPIRDGDPHWWHDPVLFERAANALAARLAQVDPDGAATFRRNATRYVARLRSMDDENRRLVSCLPPDDRKLVTNHDAFGYFARHYGFTIIGSVIPSLSTASQPSAKQIASLIDRIRQQHVRAIFTESSINPGLERQIADEAGVTVSASLYGDTLGPAGSSGATYLSMERWNVRTIVAGLLGHQPPADGCSS